MTKHAAQLDNVTSIKEAFEQPQWYFQRTAFNITLRVETIAEFLGAKRFDAILDIGCGNGSLSLPLLGSHNTVTFMDQSKAMLNLVRSRIPAAPSPQTRFVNSGFMEAEGLEPRSFDLILCVGVLAYIRIEDRRDFLLKIKSLLKPGGSLILECTDGPHIMSRISRCYTSLIGMVKPPKMRTVVGSSADVLSTCQDLQFERLGYYRYSMPPPGVSKFMSQKVSYQAVRWLFGTVRTAHHSWLGNECLYHLRLS